ncbi:Putative signal transduction response regulator, receiver domain, CheY-like superfamily [Septoria linicola]|uniref:Signal transduction response regulator, receiver domain, CheY-like superfamily n=1 Tax=Septoria linicola TaxID=215465 RepID=A0A9Q9EIP0_9PEZI|nr:putative signal transduction response regulator, receiver domain, CheY-like superfamily [Septoria linicola]USW52230.1 Putative signal transduction response regulator, receiver domain, CheY-like superfamily [Septoria linicola]
MARFSLRPILRRLSSKHSTTADSTKSDGSDNSTAATSASPSPSPDVRSSSRRRPRKTRSLAQLKDKFRQQQQQDAARPPTPQGSRASSVSVIDEGLESTTTQQRDIDNLHDDNDDNTQQTAEHLRDPTRSPSQTLSDTSDTRHEKLDSAGQETLSQPTTPSPPLLKLDVAAVPVNPLLTVEEPTPEALGSGPRRRDISDFERRPTCSTGSQHRDHGLSLRLGGPLSQTTSHQSLAGTRGTGEREQSLVGSPNAKIVRTTINAPAHDEHPLTSASTTAPSALPTASLTKYFTQSIPDMAAMLNRKIWVKRPNASATLVQIREDDLVDDVRDMILRKYANSLGRTFDAPDLTLTIVTRSEHAGPRSSRMLGPEEEMSRTIDSYYPGGQTVDEALIIDLPQKKTPRPSPRAIHHSYHALDEFRPPETGTDYFPPMPVNVQPALPPHLAREHHGTLAGDHPRSISVLNTGQVPPLPSPGAAGRRHRSEREHRPRIGRQHTSSPTIITHGSHAGQPNGPVSAIPPTHLSRSTRPRVDSSASEATHRHDVPAAPPLPTPPAPEAGPTGKPNSNPPTPNTVVPNGLRGARPRKNRKPTPDKLSKGRSGTPQLDIYNPNPNLSGLSSVLDGSVPPINVLIVEDNIINLRILEGLMKRLKVRWQTAMNGQIAVDKWKTGGYHLVLMDIQMPVMNGLQATKEIRRLERVNGIGVFSATPGSATENGPPDQNGSEKEHKPEDDKLDMSNNSFKSPIIIVALTASSLQSDRHEALAAGCNDFLTKPVNFVWLERKVKEWGCMQALIDYDGWRQWKDFAEKENAGKSEEQKQKEREQEEKQKTKMAKMAILQEKQRKTAEAQAKEKERKKRESLGETLPPPVGPEEPPVANGTVA